MKKLFIFILAIFLLGLTACTPEGHEIIKDDWTTEQKIEQAIINKLGKYTNRTTDDKTRIVRVGEVKIVDNAVQLTLAGDSNWDEKAIVQGMYEKVKQIMPLIKQYLPQGTERVSFTFTYSFVDKDYNSVESRGLLLDIPAAKFDINWENMPASDVPTIAENHFIQPSLDKK